MHALTEKIASLQRRLLWRRRAAAACSIAATAIAAALLLGAVDYIVRFADTGLRIMATLALVSAILWSAYRWWYLPSRRQISSLAVARRIEQHFPQLGDLLASAVEFLAQSEDDRAAGSAQLRRMVVSEAQNTVDGLPLDEIIDRRPLRRAAAWLAVAAMAIVACAAWDSAAVGTALARLAAPLGDTQWPRQHYLAFLDAPTRLAAGQTFEAELVDTAGPLPDDVRIEYRIASPNGTQTTIEPMRRAGDAMIARRENVRESFAFRAVGGDDHSMRWHQVEVIEPPKLESLSIDVHPPAYTALPPTKAERHLEVLERSGLEVRGAANRSLSSARILMGGAEPIIAEITADDNGRARRAFHLSPGRWIAAKSGPYSLELGGADGLAAVVGSWNLRVLPDSPPSISWRRPTSDLYVTAAAVVPIELAVHDNLAVHHVDLVFRRTDRLESQRERQPTDSKVELYRGSEKAPHNIADTAATQGEARLIRYAWDLAPLQMPAGTELTLNAEATDYRPGVGRTAVPRRLKIINADELEARLADLQTQIVRQLERGLALQQNTREVVRRLQIQLEDAGNLSPGDRNALQTAELNQRRVKQTLADESEGVPALVRTLLEQIEINRIATDALSTSMDRLQREIERLSVGPLSVAERELVAARKAGEVSASTVDAKALSASLSSAGGAEDEVIAALERLIGDLADRSDYRRLARDLAELRQDQLAHAETSRAEIGLETLPLQLNELTRLQRANLNKAAAGQQALARRYEKLVRAMEQLASNLTSDEDDAAAALSEAVELARRLAIGMDMRETARDFGENRIGQAMPRQRQIADNLQQVIDTLRNQRENRPPFAENLREAEQRLAQIRNQTAAIRQQLAEAETGNPNAQPLEQLSDEQASLKREIEGLADQLERLQAPDAGQSTRSAASRLGNRAADASQGASPPARPASSSDAQQAEQDLAQAAQQLAQRRQQAEDDLALEFVRRFQAELGKMVERQRQVVDRTMEIDATRRPDEPLEKSAVQGIAQLAAEERMLSQLAREHRELLFGLAAVRISLQQAERLLADAARRLDTSDTGPTTQQAEQNALARLEGMFEAFAQTASEAAPNDPPPNSDAAQAGEQPQRRPTFELLEVKMLRMLQADLNERTRAYKQRLANLAETASDREQATLLREAQQLQAEQGTLAELVQEMLNRDNEQRRE